MGAIKNQIEDMAEKLIDENQDLDHSTAFSMAMQVLQANADRAAGHTLTFCHECECETAVVVHHGGPHCKYCGHEV